MPATIQLGRLDIPRPPRPRQPVVYGNPNLFGPFAGRALDKLLPCKFDRATLLAGQAIVDQLNLLEVWFNARGAQLEAASDSEYFQYAKAIAQHSAALGELLYGVPLPASLSAPGSLTIQAREALYHMGTPEGVSADDMLSKADRAGRGIVFLHYVARHAVGEWAELVKEKKASSGKTHVRSNPGKPHVRGLVRSLAEIYRQTFGVPEKRQPSATSPEVVFCDFLAKATFKRLARFHGSPLPRQLMELRALDCSKIAEILRPPRRRRAKPPPGAAS